MPVVEHCPHCGYPQAMGDPASTGEHVKCERCEQEYSVEAASSSERMFTPPVATVLNSAEPPEAESGGSSDEEFDEAETDATAAAAIDRTLATIGAVLLLLLAITPFLSWVEYTFGFISSGYQLQRVDSRTAKGTDFWEGWLFHTISLALVLVMARWWSWKRMGQTIPAERFAMMQGAAAGWATLVLAISFLCMAKVTVPARSADEPFIGGRSSVTGELRVNASWLQPKAGLTACACLALGIVVVCGVYPDGYRSWPEYWQAEWKILLLACILAMVIVGLSADSVSPLLHGLSMSLLLAGFLFLLMLRLDGPYSVFPLAAMVLGLAYWWLVPPLIGERLVVFYRTHASQAWYWDAALPFLSVPSVYVAGYFLLGAHSSDRSATNDSPRHVRHFPYKSLAQVFLPLAWCERRIRMDPVVLEVKRG